MSEKWSDADMARFLDAYQNYDVLWNPRTELYRNLQARRAALQAIIQIINKPKMCENDLKNKIKNIRTTYNRELAKVVKSEKSGTGRDDVYVPSLVWFEQADTFLRAVTMGGRKSQSNMTSQNLSQLTEDFEDPSQQMQQVTESNFQLDIDNYASGEVTAQYRSQPYLLNTSPKDTQQHQPSTSATRNSTEHGITTPRNRSLLQRKYKRKICEVSGSSSIDKALSKLEDISKRCVNDDEFATFGKPIANQLRQLPLHKALEIQQQFQNTLTQERINYLNSMALSTHQYTSEGAASHNTTPEVYYSSDYTEFSSVCSHTSMDNNPSSEVLAAALASISNETKN